MSRRVVGNKTILAIDAVSLAIGFYYGVYHNILSIELPPQLAKAGHWQFLTNLSLAYTLIVVSIGFLAHLTKSKPLFDLKNLLHPVGLALECVVAVIYWPLRLFFIHLLTIDSTRRIPMKVDLSIHLMPVVTLLIDYLVFMPKWSIRNSTAFVLVVTMTSFYWVLLKYLIDVESGASYPYAFLNVETEKERLIVFGLVALVSFTQFLLLRGLHDTLVPSPEVIDEKIDKLDETIDNAKHEIKKDI